MSDVNDHFQQLRQTEHFYVAQTTVDHQNETSVASLALTVI